IRLLAEAARPAAAHAAQLPGRLITASETRDRRTQLAASARRPPRDQGIAVAVRAGQASVPPSMMIDCPVIQAPARLARNTAAAAMSSGSPRRRSGVTRDARTLA